MRYKIGFFALLIIGAPHVFAQQFINKGVIEFEVTTNVKKTMSNSNFMADLKESMPTFKVAFYNYTFADNKSIYKFDHYDEKKAKVPDFLRNGEEDSEWYSDFTSGISSRQKNKWGSMLNLKDSIKNIQWKITNESRMIAGFNCRKAVGVIMDSVYVFAFYTDEITISGGPCTIYGLPGMILGVTIPRMYVSMLATKLMVNNVDVSIIKPIVVKKYYTTKELKAILDKRVKDDGMNDDDDDVKWIQHLYWNMLL